MSSTKLPTNSIFRTSLTSKFETTFVFFSGFDTAPLDEPFGLSVASPQGLPRGRCCADCRRLARSYRGQTNRGDRTRHSNAVGLQMLPAPTIMTIISQYLTLYEL